MTVGLILMTAMPPTKGHGHLIRWAKNYMEAAHGETRNTIYVMVGTQPSEPMPYERYTAIDKFCKSLRRGDETTEVRAVHFHKEVQQQPKGPDDKGFWDDWNINIRETVPSFGTNSRWGSLENLILFSSEEYGTKLAEVLGCQHVPVDPKRELVLTKATKIRENLWDNYKDLLPEFLPYVQKTFTIFGAESTGKTTLAKCLSGHNSKAQFVHEWARPYLESLSSPETTGERMETIVHGQYAAQVAAKTTGKLVIIQDTDLLSTIGYYRIYCEEYEKLPGYQKCLKLFANTKADHYFVLPSNIPFEADPLRYGGDKRESTDEFWIDLLKEFKCQYTILERSKNRAYFIREKSQVMEVYDKLMDNPIWGFKREGNK